MLSNLVIKSSLRLERDKFSTHESIKSAHYRTHEIFWVNAYRTRTNKGRGHANKGRGFYSKDFFSDLHNGAFSQNFVFIH